VSALAGGVVGPGFSSGPGSGCQSDLDME